MKLVDILARELKSWPEEWGIFCVSSKVEGSFAAWFGYRNPVFVDGGWSDIGAVELWLSEEPEDRKCVVVRRFEWQAAVDALKADKIVYSSENVNADIGYVTLTETPANAECKITPRPWTGEGLPPVGTVCEMSFFASNEWELCMPVHYLEQPIDHSDQVVVYQDSLGGEVCYILDPPCSGSIEFRPIRTPEQIAAEERDKAIEGMIADTNILTGIMSDRRIMAGQLYDAGYRKFEIVDN